MSSTETLAPSIPPNAPVGGLTFTKPAATSVSYYKIAPSIPITFGWNFTALYVTPTALTVSAYCASNKNTYTVGPSGGIIPGTATEIVWEPWTYQTGAGQQTPLAQATYTLQVYDERSTANPSPGFFEYNTQMTFALYTPQPYTPLAEWTCAGCKNAAPGSLQPHPAVFGIVATAVVMLISGWGILRHMVDRRQR